VEAQARAYYFDVLYPFQDQVLQLITRLDTGFHLTGKAAGIFPADLARLLCTVTHADWEVIRWIEAPLPDQFVSELRGLGEQLVLGVEKNAP